MYITTYAISFYLFLFCRWFCGWYLFYSWSTTGRRVGSIMGCVSQLGYCTDQCINCLLPYLFCSLNSISSSMLIFILLMIHFLKFFVQLWNNIIIIILAEIQILTIIKIIYSLMVENKLMKYRLWIKLYRYALDVCTKC